MELPLPSYSADEAAIHRLVDDVLAYIFFLNATLPDPDCREHATTVASSQVCMRWRSIALHCHRIWGPIINYSHPLKWIETLLDRSHPSSLDFGSRIKTVYLKDGDQGVLELVFNHIDKLRTFNVQVPTRHWELVCSRFLQLPAPNLEFVNVNIVSNTRQLTHPLFDHHAPNLQNLQLRRCTVDFTSPILTTLTELYVRDIAEASAVPTVLDWLNILGGMPSLRWVTLHRAISSATTNDVIYPIIHLAALNMLSVDGALHGNVTLVEHLIVPPRCGLRLSCDSDQVDFDQRKLWTIIEKKMDSFAKYAPNRRLEAYIAQDRVAVGNLPYFGIRDTEAEAVHYKWHGHLLDPIVTITLRLSNPQDTVPLFISLFTLFERTFLNTTFLKLFVDYEPDDGPEVFLPLVDSFRSFVNLEVMYLGYDSMSKFLYPLLQHSFPNSNSVLLPALQSLLFCNARFRHTSNSLLRLADFLRWRREQGFPVQKINIFESSIDRQYILTQIQDSVVEFGCCNYSDTSEDDSEEEDNN
jgi:hypothetical protein